MRSFEQNWSKQEDKLLADLVLKNKKSMNWESIAKQIKSKTSKQCQNRYNQRNEWKAEQISCLFKLHRQMPSRWKQISQQLQRKKQQTGHDDQLAKRTEHEVKNTFYNSFRKGLRKIGKVFGKKNSTNKVRQIKPNKISRILKEYIEKYKNDFIYDVVLECAFDRGKNFQSRKQQLEDIYSFFHKDVDQQKSNSSSLNRQKISKEKKEKKENEQKKLDINRKKMEILTQNKNLVSKREQSEEEAPELRITRSQDNNKKQQRVVKIIQQRIKPIISSRERERQREREKRQRERERQRQRQRERQKQRQRERQREREKRQRERERQRQREKRESPKKLDNLNIERIKQKQKKSSLSFFSVTLKQSKERQQQQNHCRDSNRSITRSLSALIQASSKTDNYKLPQVTVSQKESMEIKQQVFTSRNGPFSQDFPIS